ncbi:mini-chromosome maintenance complex-binding protein-like [Amphiura filiformis]|uniref:mini-chromosome maintenance complex-binding protein-like n=1 Tax=Amphiura filiformis TaxID=82378 RepID=UPI003B20EF58
MPAIEDWLNRPLDIIQGMFDHSNKDWSNKVVEYFQRRLDDKNTLEWVPSLNSSPLHQLKPNCLVRFRCMVQDTYDPEFYLGVYEVQDKNTGTKILKSGKYQDVAECVTHQRINMESPNNVTLDRQTLYCVPIPAENEWVKQAYAENCQHQPTPSTSTQQSRVKRALEEDEVPPLASSEATMSEGGDAMETSKVSEAEKRTRTEGASSSTQQGRPGGGVDLNFPLAGEKGPACLVKVYDTLDAFKVNEMVEFVGVLSVDPVLATFTHQNGSSSAVGEPDEVMDGIEEESAHSPPPSLVPRLHVILSQRLQHVNPLLPKNVTAPETKPFVDSVLQEAGVIRDQLRLLLQQLCLGDAFAADYLLLHLISCVYARRDVVALGKFGLNLSGCPAGPEFISLLSNQIKELVCKSHVFPLSLQNMNSSLISPKKDYSANRLKSGALQLTERTHLILDETAMEPGQLDATGVQNLTALGNLIAWQKVEYDFNFHKTDFPANVTVLVLSEGKSLLPSDCQVPIQPKTDAPNMAAIQNTIQQQITSGAIDIKKIRTFIGLIQLLEYTLSDDIQKIVEDDFVEARKADLNSMTQEDFHSLLVIARLLSLSTGQTSLTREVWERAKRMESARKVRLRTVAAAAVPRS